MLAFPLTIAKHQKLLTLARCDLSQQRQKVEWNSQRVLAHNTTWVCSGRIEISQQSTVPLLIRLSSLLQVVALGFDMIRDTHLNGRLGATIGVGWSNGAMFRDRDHVGDSGGISVDGGRGREDDVCHIVLGHAAEEGDRTADVDTVVFKGLFARFSNGLVEAG